MSEQLYVDPGHRLPDEDWAAVVRRAKEIREQEQASAQGGAASGIAPILDMTALGLASGKFFPVSGIPTQLLVLHSGESPLQGGFAKSLTEWAGSVYPAPPIASWTWFVDPLHIVYFIPAHLGAWHASEANNLSEAFEQSGYARYTRAQWLTPDGKTQMESLAWLMAQRALANKIPARWLTTAEVTRATNGDRSVKGLCLHRQIDPETRTDPGDGYPLDLLLARIKFYMAGGTVTTQSTQEDELSAEEVKTITDAIAEVKNIANNTWAGVWKGGSYNGKQFNYGILPIVVETQRRDAIAQAQITNLVGAIAALASGEKFDEAKLLAGVQAAAEAGVKAGLEGGTVTVDVNVHGKQTP